MTFTIDRGEILLYTLVIGSILALVWVLSFFPVMLLAEQRCLALGYASYSVDWSYRAYCVTRVDQTDIVVPLATAPRRPR